MCDAWITCGVNSTIWNLNVVKEKVNFCPGFENSDEGVTIKQKKKIIRSYEFQTVLLISTTRSDLIIDR